MMLLPSTAKTITTTISQFLIFLFRRFTSKTPFISALRTTSPWTINNNNNNNNDDNNDNNNNSNNNNT